MAKKKVTRSVKKAIHHTKTHAHAGYHPEHIAMMYRLGGGGIIVLGGTIIIFVVKAVCNL